MAESDIIPHTRLDLAEILHRHDSDIPTAAQEIVKILGLEQEKYKSVCTQLAKVNEQHKKSRKFLDVLKEEWWDTPIPWSPTFKPQKKIISQGKQIIEIDISQEIRKPLSQLTSKGLRRRLSPLLNLIEVLAEKEETDSISIAAYALQLISQELSDKKLPIVCKEIISTGTFSRPLQHMPTPKSVFLLNLLEIGKRKYTELRHLCKSENFIFPSYNTISEYRSNVMQSIEFQSIKNPRDETIGIGISYRSLLHHTVSRLLETIDQNIDSIVYPLTLRVSDGLDGSGSHKMYNQLHEDPNFNTKSYILFGFKILSLVDNSGNSLFVNDVPNSPFGLRPVLLL